MDAVSKDTYSLQRGGKMLSAEKLRTAVVSRLPRSWLIWLCAGIIGLTSAIKVYLAVFEVCPLGLNGWVEDPLGLGLFLAGYSVPRSMIYGPEQGTYFLLAWIMCVFFKLGMNLHHVLWLCVSLSILTVVVVYLMCKRIFGQTAGALAATLVSVNYLYTWYSLCLTADAPAVFFSTLSVWLYLLSIEQDTKYLPFAAAALALAFLARYEQILLLLVFGAHYAMRTRAGLSIKRDVLAWSFASFCIPIVAWQLYNYIIFGKLFKPYVLTWNIILGNVTSGAANSLLLRALYYVGKAYYVISPIGLLVFCVGLVKAVKNGGNALLMVFWLSVFTLLALVAGLQDERYFLWWFIPLISITSYGLAELFFERGRRGLLYAGLLVFLSIVLLTYSKFPPPFRLGNGISSIDWSKAPFMNLEKHRFIFEYVIENRILPPEKYPKAYFYLEMQEKPPQQPKPFFPDALMIASFATPLISTLSMRTKLKRFNQ